MTAQLRITKISVTATGGAAMYLKPFLTNTGNVDVPTGTVVAKQTSRDGTVESLSFYNNTTLSPGETTTLILQIFNAKNIVFSHYEIRGQENIPLRGKASSGIFKWSLSDN